MVTLNGDSTMEISQGSSYSELGASADTGEQVTITGTVDTNVPGTYTLTYTATDAAGNVGTATREIVITGNSLQQNCPLYNKPPPSGSRPPPREDY